MELEAACKCYGGVSSQWSPEILPVSVVGGISILQHIIVSLNGGGSQHRLKCITILLMGPPKNFGKNCEAFKNRALKKRFARKTSIWTAVCFSTWKQICLQLSFRMLF